MAKPNSHFVFSQEHMHTQTTLYKQIVIMGKSIHQIPLFMSFLPHIFLPTKNACSQYVQVEQIHNTQIHECQEKTINMLFTLEHICLVC
jgi:hypothetical protein